MKWYFNGLTGTNSFFTSSTARSSFMCARFSVSSTVIRTCNSSERCSQLGFPRFASSCKIEEKKQQKQKRNNVNDKLQCPNSQTHTHTHKSFLKRENFYHALNVYHFALFHSQSHDHSIARSFAILLFCNKQ